MASLAERSHTATRNIPVLDRVFPEYHEKELRALEQFRPTMSATDITKIDFSLWAEHGIRNWFFDAEGTIAGLDRVDPDPEILEHIRTARENGFIDNVVIVSNKKPSTENSFAMMSWWAHEIGADLVMTPLSGADRKPGTRMLLKAMLQLGIKPESVAMVGDKLTADILAANRLGIHSVHVDNLGNDDVLGDQIFRRPMETIIKSRFGMEANVPYFEHKDLHPSAQAIAALIDSEAEIIYDKQTEKAEYHAYSQIMAGYGDQPIVRLSDEIEELIPSAWHGFITEPVRGSAQAWQERHPEIMNEYDKFVANDGQVAADIVTLSRLPGTALIVQSLLSDHQVRAAITKLVSWMGDKLDGSIAKRYRKKNGDAKRTWISNHEDLFDKVQSNLSSFTLAKLDKLPQWHAIVRGIRDMGMTARRKHYADLGIDVDAIPSGKLSTGLVEIADSLAIFKRTPTLATIATFSKLVSWYDAERTWRRRLEEKPRLDEVKCTLSIGGL